MKIVKDGYSITTKIGIKDAGQEVKEKHLTKESFKNLCEKGILVDATKEDKKEIKETIKDIKKEAKEEDKKNIKTFANIKNG